MDFLDVHTNGVENCIKAIGQELINKAEQIADDDMNKISKITIHAELNPDEILNFDITKNYIVSLNKGD